MQKIYMKTLIFLLKSGKSALMISKGGREEEDVNALEIMMGICLGKCNSYFL